jgi:hypothetical protein
MFTPLVFGYLVPKQFIIAALLLVSAAVFDCVQTLSLNKSTAPTNKQPNIHSVTAWLMALSYFGYALVICRIADVPVLIYGSALLLCGLFVALANKALSRGVSLQLQMTYFILVSLVGVFAHIKLMFK